MKLSNIRRVVLTIAILACASVPLYRALAYNNQDIISVDVNADADLVCKSQRVMDALNRIEKGYVKQLVKDVINEFKSLVKTYAFQIVACYVTHSDKVVKGGIVIAGVEIIFKGPNCGIDLGGATSSAIKRAAIDKIRNDFASSCISDVMRKQVENDIRRITRENGPDGGPAMVVDWVGLISDEDQRGINRFNAILVNTHICPYFRDAVYEYFGVPQSYIDNPPALTGLGMRVDGADSFIQKAECTVPDDFTPEALDTNFLEMGGFEAFYALQIPPNNFDGFIELAEEELSKQRNAVVSAAVNEAIAGGGFRGVYGDVTQSCINRDPDGNCLVLGPVQQPSGGIRDANAAAMQASLDVINSGKVLGDVRTRVASMVLSLNVDPLDYIVSPDRSTQRYEEIGAGTRQPDEVVLQPANDSGGQGQTDGGGGGGGSDGSGGATGPTPQPTSCGSTTDPTCNNNNPSQCFCVRSCSGFTSVTDQFALATRAACQQFPENVDNPDSCATVLPGRELNFLAAICQTTVGEEVIACHTKAGTNNQIVGDFGGITMSIQVISPTGAILIPGELVAACQPGAQ